MNIDNNPYLVDGKYAIGDLVDMDKLRVIFEKFTQATGFTIGFLDHPGMNILIATGWRDICTKFHRGCPLSAAICLKSNGHLLNNLNEPRQTVIEECDNGLVDCAVPIIIKGKHIASLATGQLLLKEPDIERFKKQARTYGFEESKYLEALRKIPVVPEKKVREVTSYLGEIASTISEIGYTNLELKDKALELEKEISERKQAQAEKDSLNAELLGKKTEMENFLYITTHDLRGPLVNIQGFGQSLKEYCQEFKDILSTIDLPPETRKAITELTQDRISVALNFITESSLRMDSLISSLLKVSRLGRVEMVPERVDMNAIFKDVLTSLRFRFDKAGAVVKMEDLPVCWADHGAAVKIFTNLMDNAIKYSDPSRRPEILVRGEVKAGRAVYTVSDNGVGISKANLPKIWQIHYAAVGSDGKKGGEGIGLPIVKRLADMNGGSITAESIEGQGSSFYVEFPAGEKK